MATILLVEDEETMRLLTCAKLRNRFTILCANDGVEALEVLERRQIDLIIADVMMPRMDGYTLVKRLREEGNGIPVLLLTARQSFEDKREGFSSGIDDYMTKPVNYEELTWRINALLRRAHIANERKIVAGNTVLDSTTYTVTHGDSRLELPPKEFELLYKLLSYPGQIFTRNQLLDSVWGYDSESGEDTVKTHISRLRNKLRDVEDFHIVTVASVAPFALLHAMDRFYWARASSLFVLGMLFFMGAVVGVTATLFSRRFNKLVSGLTEGLTAVAGGDFSRQLDPEKGGPLKQAYEDFNKMCGELQSVQTLRTDFIDNFSHEFKTSITAVKGFAELLREEGVSPEEKEQYIQIIIDESSRLADLANSALLLSGLESQQYISGKEVYLLDEQIKRCAILLSSAWEEKKIAFSAELESVRYYGNEELMRHVWLNLLGDAVKYTPEGGEIGIALQAGPEEVTVRVTDTGVGMSEEVQAHVFDKYYQGEAGKRGKGLGLGLAIVHRIVELCGGRIEVSSVEEQGSVFTVTLPLEDGPGT